MKDSEGIHCEWFEKGLRDIEVAQFLYDHNHYTDAIALNIHQALEKYLKGFLLKNGWTLQKPHDLITLASRAESRIIPLSGATVSGPSRCPLLCGYAFRYTSAIVRIRDASGKTLRRGPACARKRRLFTKPVLSPSFGKPAFTRGLSNL